MNYNEVVEVASSFAEAEASPHFHKTSFRVRKKIFATIDDKKGTLVVKMDEINQSVFSDMGRENIHPVPGGWGLKGWTIIHYSQLESEVIVDAMTISYNLVAPKSLQIH